MERIYRYTFQAFPSKKTQLFALVRWPSTVAPSEPMELWGVFEGDLQSQDCQGNAVNFLSQILKYP